MSRAGDSKKKYATGDYLIREKFNLYKDTLTLLSYKILSLFLRLSFFFLFLLLVQKLEISILHRIRILTKAPW